jgi:hypothetical protein
MKKMNYKVIALTASITLLLSGCETMQKATSGLGSTGTGVIAGVVAGAGTGFACDKLTGGKHTGACVAAGMAVGAAVGTWAASIDESEAAKEAPVRCVEVKEHMKYPATATAPVAFLRLDEQKSLVIKPGEKFVSPVKMDFAVPGEEGKEEEVAIKADIDINNSTSSAKLTRECGGQATLPLVLESKELGAHNTTIKLSTAEGSPIQGGTITFCYTVATDGVNKCGMAKSPSLVPEKTVVEPVKKSVKKKRKNRK